MKEWFCENRLRGFGHMFLAFTSKLCKKQGGMCYTTKCDTVEDGLTERASKGNLGGGVKGLSRHYRVTRVMSGETGNLVVKVNVKENVEEGLTMANTRLLEAWVSSGKANSVSGKANQVTWVSQMCSSYPNLSRSDQGYLKVTLANYVSGEAGVRLGQVDSVLGRANGVVRVASGLPRLA
jgi:hypothetical protein